MTPEDGPVTGLCRKATKLSIIRNKDVLLEIFDFKVLEYAKRGPVGSYLQLSTVNTFGLSGDFILFLRYGGLDEGADMPWNQLPEPKRNTQIWLIDTRPPVKTVTFADLPKRCLLLHASHEQQTVPCAHFFINSGDQYNAVYALSVGHDLGCAQYARKVGDGIELAQSLVPDACGGAARVFVDGHGWRWLLPHAEGPLKSLEVLKATTMVQDWIWLRANLAKAAADEREIVRKHFAGSAMEKDVNECIQAIH